MNVGETFAMVRMLVVERGLSRECENSTQSIETRRSGERKRGKNYCITKKEREGGTNRIITVVVERR